MTSYSYCPVYICNCDHQCLKHYFQIVHTFIHRSLMVSVPQNPFVSVSVSVFVFLPRRAESHQQQARTVCVRTLCSALAGQRSVQSRS